MIRIKTILRSIFKGKSEEYISNILLWVFLYVVFAILGTPYMLGYTTHIIAMFFTKVLFFVANVVSVFLIIYLWGWTLIDKYAKILHDGESK